MENSIYSVEIEIHYEGIYKYFLFSSSQKARDFAQGYMDGTPDEEFRPDTSPFEDVISVWEGTGKDVIIRKKDLLG